MCNTDCMRLYCIVLLKTFQSSTCELCVVLVRKSHYWDLSTLKRLFHSRNVPLFLVTDQITSASANASCFAANSQFDHWGPCDSCNERKIVSVFDRWPFEVFYAHQNSSYFAYYAITTSSLLLASVTLPCQKLLLSFVGHREAFSSHVWFWSSFNQHSAKL